MKRFLLITIIAGLASSGLWAQEPVNPKKTPDPTAKMSLRVNTRDRVMICRGNAAQVQIQKRMNPTLRRTQMMRHQRMMQHHRGIREFPMRRNMQRRALEQQMMQQQQRRMNQQSDRPGGR